jgi:hypothetical protein
MLCTVEQYQLITSDSDSATAEAEVALIRAQNVLEEALGRKGFLEYGSRTETLRLRPDGTIYPQAWPVDPATTGFRVVGDVLYGVSPDSSPAFPGAWPRCEPVVATVTYLGGFGTGDDVPAICETPQCIIDDIAWAAHGYLTNPAESRFPVGATLVASGDQQVGFGSRGAPSPGDPYVWSVESMRYRRQT